jgi:hypothetical protein
MKNRTFVQTAASCTSGSLPTFAAAAHEINLKLEGEWRLRGTKLAFAAAAPMAAFSLVNMDNHHSF